MNADLDRAWLERGGPDVAFDPWLNVSPEAQAELKQALSQALGAGRDRRRKSDPDARLGPLLGCIFANAIVATDEGPGARVGYSRGHHTYEGETVYKPDFLHSKQLVRTIDQLKGAGILACHTGDRRGHEYGERQLSTYWLTPKGEALVAQVGIGRGACSRDPAAPLIELRDEQGKPMDYDPAVVAQEAEALRSYNDFLAGFDIGMPSDIRVVNAGKKTLFRIYNRGSFEKGGRFYRGWWETVPPDCQTARNRDPPSAPKRDPSRAKATPRFTPCR